MSFGLIAGIVVIGAFAVWGIPLMRSKIVEKPTEASSHSEGDVGGHPGLD